MGNFKSAKTVLGHGRRRLSALVVMLALASTVDAVSPGLALAQKNAPSPTKSYEPIVVGLSINAALRFPSPTERAAIERSQTLITGKEDGLGLKRALYAFAALNEKERRWTGPELGIYYWLISLLAKDELSAQVNRMLGKFFSQLDYLTITPTAAGGVRVRLATRDAKPIELKEVFDQVEIKLKLDNDATIELRTPTREEILAAASPKGRIYFRSNLEQAESDAESDQKRDERETEARESHETSARALQLAVERQLTTPSPAWPMPPLAAKVKGITGDFKSRKTSVPGMLQLDTITLVPGAEFDQGLKGPSGLTAIGGFSVKVLKFIRLTRGRAVL